MTFIPVIGRRLCAVLAAGSAGLHAAMLGHAGGPVATGLLVAMIAACLYCARDLWRDDRVRSWVIVALMNLAMIALHLPGPGHSHGTTVGSQPSTLMAAATVVALIEVAAAAAVLYLRSRGQYARLIGTPDR
ncbi:hypothetical protein [Mycolicibacterium phlei]